MRLSLKFIMATSYELWTVSKLKTELVRRNAVTRGRKTDLVERLKSYDRNKDFLSPPVALPESQETDWPRSGFENLSQRHKDQVPKVDPEQVEGYFLYRMAEDNEAVGDLKALEKGQRLYEASRILACSLLLTAVGIFFSGIVGASMKNKVTYNFKLKLELETGEPVNSDCECPAGKGPHATCKHIAAVLLMLTKYTTTGEVQVDKSCTENLQTFHKPKAPYKGSPIKADNIAPKRKWSGHLLDDPRPAKYRNMTGYNDFVRNSTVNFCSRTSRNLALRYIYPKADLHSAAIDHDYLDVPFTEHWVDESLKVTQESASDIERNTRNQRKSVKWLQERNWRLTASRFGEIIKITNRRNKDKLCSSLTSTSKINSKAILHGIQYEKKAISKFEETFNIKSKKSGLFVSVKYPFLGATPDAVIDTDHLIEVKCPYSGRLDKIAPGKYFPYLCYNSDGNIALKSSSHYYNQIQGQLRYLSLIARFATL